MKRLSLLILLLAIVSCSNDDENVKLPVKDGNILGKWYYKEMTVDGTVIPYTDHEECGKDYIEFFDTNKIKSVDIWDCEEDVDWVGTFTKEGTLLTFSVNENSMSSTIIELSDHVLSYVYYEDRTGDGIDEQYIATFDR